MRASFVTSGAFGDDLSLTKPLSLGLATCLLLTLTFDNRIKAACTGNRSPVEFSMGTFWGL
jgi:hypothetical protein